MKNLLMRIKTHNNMKLNDDEFIEECMDMLQAAHPSISGYHYEREDEHHIQLLLYGDFNLQED